MPKDTNTPVIVAYGRSAIGKSNKKRNGYFCNTHPVDLGGLVLKGVLERVPQFDPTTLQDVIVGAANHQGLQSRNMARLIALRAGCGWNVPGQTINRFCSSGLQAISTAANMISAGQADLVATGGVESMSANPMGYPPETRNQWLLENDDPYMPMGITAENVAERYNVSREDMDAFAVESHKKAAAAQASGIFKSEIITLPGVDTEGNTIMAEADQGIRADASVESLAALKPAFKEGGKVTAGTASQTSDAAAFVVIMSAQRAREQGVKPLARLVTFAVSGVEPAIMGIGPIKAIPRVMELAGMEIGQIDCIELNEAFAAQAIPCIRILRLDPKKVNPCGGAIAMGHPLGATGAVLTCKAINQLERSGGRYALVSMCIGGGMGAAGIIEKL